jgi:hypothetical protein
VLGKQSELDNNERRSAQSDVENQENAPRQPRRFLSMGLSAARQQS